MVIHGDCVEVMAGMEPASVDAVVTDPPYGLEFMGKGWDRLIDKRDSRNGLQNRQSTQPYVAARISYQAGANAQAWHLTWATEALRVLKPGGYLLAFGGTRTFHRLAVAIEDAGFEIRDCLSWMYGSGFPKSLDVSKAIDKAAGAEREIVGRYTVPADSDAGNAGKVIRSVTAESMFGVTAGRDGTEISAPATADAVTWQGWGTALKPAWEIILWAQKPYSDVATIGSCLSSLTVSIAERLSPSSRSVYEQPGSAPQRVGRLLNTLGGSSDQTDTRQSDLALTLSLNIVSSWRLTLDGLSNDGSRFTIGTASSLTTELKTLSYLLSRLTPAIMLQAATEPDGCPALVAGVDDLFNVVAMRLSATRTLSALGLVTEQGHTSLPVEGGLPDLAPAWEPIIMARKPLVGTVAANVLKYGTGAINVDASRIGTGGDKGVWPVTDRNREPGWGMRPDAQTDATKGRWPANVVLDEEAAAMLDEQSGEVKGQVGMTKTAGGHRFIAGDTETVQKFDYGRTDTGGASRFFYTAKADSEERSQGLGQRNSHPTVKPISLMSWLVRMVTPPGGIVLDPFLGSGTTALAAIGCGFDWIGIEQSAEYVEIARQRIGLFAA